MNAILRRTLVGTAAVSMALGMAACGSAKQSSGSSSSSGSSAGVSAKDLKIGLLLPESKTARYEAFDKPLITAKIKELCPDCPAVEYANANQDAPTQQQQVDAMITKGVKVLILDAVDSKAIQASVEKAVKAGIKVVAYDRLAQGPISAYTSFDNEKVGELQGQGLLDALGGKAKPDAQIVMVNGDPTDPNAGMFKAGAHKVLDGKVKIAKEYDTQQWSPDNANQEAAGAISALGKDKIVGFYSANDGMAGGIITALKAAKVSPLPPVTGQDAELAGVQRILAGEQALSIYKPYKPEADAAATFAVTLGLGKPLGSAQTGTTDSPTNKAIPSNIIPPTVLTKANIAATVVKDGLWKASDICTSAYAKYCAEAGIK